MYVKVSELLAEYSADTIYEMTQDVHCWYESTDVYFRAKIIPFAVGYGANHYAFNPVTSGWDREELSTPGHLYGHYIRIDDGDALMYIRMEEVWVNKSNLNLPH